MGVAVDYIRNGRAFGGTAARLLNNNMNTAFLRPWYSPQDGCGYYTVRDENGKKRNIVANYDTPAVLLKDEWKRMEAGVTEVALPKLAVWSDLLSNGLTETIPNGMATTIVEEQTETDAGFATVSMNGLQRSDRDRPEYDIKGYPLPIIHGEFSVDLRHLMQTRQQGRGFDVSMAKKVTRRVIEKVENMAIGEATTYNYGGYRLYGLRNHPDRFVRTLTLPTAAGWRPRVLVDEVIEMLDALSQSYFYGPYGMYYSPAWQKYMGSDYSDAYPGTLKSRLTEAADVKFMRKLEYGLSDYQIIIFQLTEDVIKAVNGMDLRTLQWEEKGGLELLFKIMCIYVTRVDTNGNGDLGVMHATAA